MHLFKWSKTKTRVASRLMPGAIAPMLLAIVASITLSGCHGGADRADQKEAADSSAQPSATPVCAVVPVEKHLLDVVLNLPGTFEAYQDVPMHAKVEGFISWIGVDRGSKVHTGQKLIEIQAPEVDAKVKEAYAHVSAADSEYKQSISALESTKSKLIEGQAKLDADSLTYSRLKQAAMTPGAIAKNEVDLSQKTVEADAANVGALKSEVGAARNLTKSEHNNLVASQNLYDAVKAMRAYLTIYAPFDGVITERNCTRAVSWQLIIRARPERSSAFSKRIFCVWLSPFLKLPYPALRWDANFSFPFLHFSAKYFMALSLDLPLPLIPRRARCRLS